MKKRKLKQQIRNCRNKKGCTLTKSWETMKGKTFEKKSA